MRPDTRAILRVSGSIEAAGLVSAVLVWMSGGLNVHGAHTNLGWFGLIVACCCIPIGSFFLLLGFAKYLGDRTRTD
jgi:hypothetical protein